MSAILSPQLRCFCRQRGGDRAETEPAKGCRDICAANVKVASVSCSIPSPDPELLHLAGEGVVSVRMQSLPGAVVAFADVKVATDKVSSLWDTVRDCSTLQP